MRYNHVCSIAFDVKSDHDSGDLTDAEILQALQERVALLKDGDGLIQEGTVWVDETDDAAFWADAAAGES